jgi:hypothetical protein
MQTFGDIADRLPALLQHLGALGSEPQGPPFFRYDVIDRERALVVEAGVTIPADHPAIESDEFFASTLPGGRYVAVTHVGHPEQLVDVTGDLLGWAAEREGAWDVRCSEAETVWGCRLELPKIDPSVEADWNHFETELKFRLAD